MNYLTLENVTWYYGEKCLFDSIFLHIDKGQKTALVAKNGAGKSTLMRLAAGLEQLKQDDAKVEIHPEARLVFLDQAPTFNPEITILDAILDSDLPALKAIREYEYALLRKDDPAIRSAAMAMDNHQAWEIEANMKELMGRMQLQDPDKLIGSLSGGQQKRVALVKALLPDPDFIILDEPTNHLDIDMIEWLENYLSKDQITLLMVTHDRYFLDRVCNQIYELDRGKLYRYKGNYSYYLESKSTRREIEQRTYDKNQRLFDAEREWVSRMPKARTTKSKARVDQFDELRDHLRNKPGDKSLQLSIKQERLGKKIVELYNVSHGYEDKYLFENIEYKFKKGERLGIAGPNGSGKTTLLKILTGEIIPKQGRVILGDTIKIGHYAQEWPETPDNKRVIDVVTDIAEYFVMHDGSKASPRALLERFLFEPGQQNVYVSQLSGGEKRRLYLLTVLLQNPNFLILDEPTNDLDILTLNILEEFLLNFEGCLVMVTHDRYFMDKLVDHLWVLDGKGNLKDYNGNYTIYRQTLREEKQNAIQEENTKSTTTKKTSVDKPRKLSYNEQKEFSKLEKDIQALEAERDELAAKFNESGLTTDDFKDINTRLTEIQNLLEEKEMRWMELAEFAV